MDVLFRAVLLDVAFIRMAEPLTPRQALPERIASIDDEDGACDEGAGVAVGNFRLDAHSLARPFGGQAPSSVGFAHSSKGRRGATSAWR
jgi:hypothetical protein